MLLRAVIICCAIVVNAEPPLNSYSFTRNNNGYDLSNTVTNNAYLRSKNSYQNDGNFYGAGDGNHKLSDVSSHSLINVGNQAGSIGSDIGSNYNGYTASNHRDEYTGYSNIYENPNSDSYTSSTRTATNTLFSGYSNPNNNAESTLNAYSNDPIHKDSDFGQYTASSSSNSKKVPAYSEFSNAAIENYSGDSVNSDLQGYRGSSGSSSYSESDQVYPSYLSGGLTSEYPFGKQKDIPYNLKGSNKYSDIFSSIPFAPDTRFTRGNTGYVSPNQDVPSYISASRPNSYFSKAPSSAIYSTGKPNKYYKYLSRYAPNSGVTYLSRERDGYHVPYGKDSRKIIIIKDSRPPNYSSRIYSDESSYAGSSGYRSKSGGFMNGYSTSPNFDAYSGSSSNYNDNPTVSRRYRISGNPMLVKRAISI
ncbi:uncharacterized protein DDB_G0283357-like [Nylanderia fulva]|uniref:uncharacterized protein DDB_G0283357-like n=1 Tax=Nylanderia fulva TaxID=613905 RepID=UPI0010FB50F5|nr:uncharacterized protein DDB_G0283357-like [Nylanderia fulva]